VTEVDAVVVGSGPNGLTAAVALAGAGLKVVVLEAADAPGGGLRTEEVTLPGFRHDMGATVHAVALASPAFRTLDLSREGLAYAQPEVPLGHAIAPGRSVLLHRSAAETAAGLGRDRSSWEHVVGGFAEHWDGLAATILDLTAVPPHSLREFVRLGVYGSPAATTPMRWVFREEETKALFAGLAAHALLPLDSLVTAGFGIFLGALGHSVGWPVAVGGSQSIADALLARLRSLGGELVTRHRVDSLAALPSARAVLLDMTPRQLLAIAGDHLAPWYARRLSRWRYAPGVFKIDWALGGPVPWLDPSLGAAGTVHIGGPGATVVASERAVARGAISDEPFLLVVQPSIADPSRAPAGKQTLWAYLHVPNGWDGDGTERIESRIETFAPGFRERILGRHVMGPAALEAWNANLVGGDIGGGATDWRQLVSRPRMSFTPWRIPSVGAGGRSELYLASSSALPAGGAHGMGGWLAAKAALKRLG
jgi:phytoene dehydrogenase-like protein